MEVDVLEFKVPVENNKTLFVWDIQPGFTEDLIYDSLYSVFSSYGPLYLCKVCPNAPLHPPGFYSLIKFYSAAQALKAQAHTDARTLFQSTPLKVRLSSKQTPHFMVSKPLSSARCMDLANHCLGFNGWTSDIITLKQLPSEEEGEREGERDGEGEGEREGERTLRFGCLMELHFPRHMKKSRAAAVVEETFTCTGPDVLLQKRCRLQKMVRDKALVKAFSSVLLCLLGDGKVMVEVKQSDQSLPDDTEGVIKVNEFSLDRLSRR